MAQVWTGIMAVAKPMREKGGIRDTLCPLTNKTNNAIAAMTHTASLPPLDLSVLEALFGDDPELRLSLLDEFVISTHSYLQEFEAAADIVAVGAVAHKLKSSARTVGANRLADLCTGLESGARTGQQARVEALLPQVAPEIARVADFVAGLPR